MYIFVGRFLDSVESDFLVLTHNFTHNCYKVQYVSLLLGKLVKVFVMLYCYYMAFHLWQSRLVNVS